MSTISIHKISIKILQLCWILVSTFKELVAIFTRQRNAIVKIAVINKTFVETYISTVSFSSNYNNKKRHSTIYNKNKERRLDVVLQSVFLQDVVVVIHQRPTCTSYASMQMVFST